MATVSSRALRSSLFAGATALIALTSGCDKSESLGEVETESASDSSETGGESDPTGGTTESGSASDSESESGVSCPTDAFVCPDGTAVGREGPNCEFAPCPGETGGETDGETDGETSGETDGETDPPACPPNAAYYEPAPCPSDLTRQLESAGCYVPCSPESDDCQAGETCTVVETDPCPGGPCAACAQDTSICLPASGTQANCDAIIGQGFTSIEEQECSDIAGKSFPCSWTIDFDEAGEFHWNNNGKVTISGTYACEDDLLQIDAPYEVSFAADTELLSWDGLEYASNNAGG